MQKEIDTLILGCTHFPFLKKAIQKVTGPSVALVDSAQAICEKLEVDFNSNQLSRTKRAQGGVQILLTDFNANYEKTARHFLLYKMSEKRKKLCFFVRVSSLKS